MSAFSARLQQAARHAGIGESQAEIAVALNRNRQTINKWFLGGEPNVQQLAHIARAFGVNATWLADGTGEMVTGGEELPVEEQELLRNYRQASAEGRERIRVIVHTLRKSMVAVAACIPPLLAPKHAEDAFNITRFVTPFMERPASILLIALRRMISALRRGFMSENYAPIV